MTAKNEKNTYTKEVGDYICLRLSRGEALRVILRENDMPNAKAFYDWLNASAEFLGQYQRAREIQSDMLVDEILEISDNGTNDWMASNDPDNEGYKLNGEAMARSRLRVDSRKWYASKVMPKKYGDRLQQDVTAVVKVEEIVERIIDPDPSKAIV